MKKEVAVIMVLFSVVFFVPEVFAQHCATTEVAQNNVSQAAANTSSQEMVAPAVNAGNKICPVMNEKIDEASKVTYEYQGKIYNLCCTVCLSSFQKDPEKYIKKVEAELQSADKSSVLVLNATQENTEK